MASLDVVEGFDHARLRRFGRLNFDGMVFDAVKNQEIDLIEARVAIEIEMRLLAIVNPTLEQFDDDEIFEETAAVVGPAERLGRRNIAEPRGKSRVRKKELGTFDDGFPDVLEKGRQQVDEARALCNRKPLFGRLHGNADFRRHGIELKFLSDSRGKNRQKFPVILQISNPGLDDIPLDIGLQKTLEENVSVFWGVVDHLGPTALPDGPPGFFRCLRSQRAPLEIAGRQIRSLFESFVLPFVQTHGQEFERGQASGKRLRHVLHHREALRSRQPNLPPLVRRVRQNLPLETQLGNLLDLIDEHRCRILFEEDVAGVFRELGGPDVVEPDVGPSFGTQVLEHGALADLPHAAHHDGFESFRSLQDFRLKRSMFVDHSESFALKTKYSLH